MRSIDGKLEEYTILSTLGHGAQSVVYKARQHSTMRVVSLKLEPSSDQSQLVNEIDVLTALRGMPGVPTLLSYGHTLDGSHFYSSTDVVGMYLLLSQIHNKHHIRLFY